MEIKQRKAKMQRSFYQLLRHANQRSRKDCYEQLNLPYSSMAELDEFFLALANFVAVLPSSRQCRRCQTSELFSLLFFFKDTQ